MNPEYEGKYHALEERHWWFRARRDLVRELVRELSPNPSARILEIGCASGVLIHELQVEGYRDIFGIDISEEAIHMCGVRGVQDVRVMDAQKLDFQDSSFDLITASDVLEHLQDDGAALRDWWRVLKPGGKAIVFVPAFPSLWSAHDVANHHYRRYGRAELREKAQRAGFVVQRESYWNATLFLPIAAIRAIKRQFSKGARNGKASSELFPPPRIINSLLYQTLNFENAMFVRGTRFRFGLSAMLVVAKPC